MSMQSRLLNRANEFLETGQQEDARRLLQAILHEDPHNEAAWFAYERSQPTADERIQVLKQFLRIEPRNWRALKAMGVLWEQKCRTTAAQPIPSRSYQIPFYAVLGLLLLSLIALPLGAIYLRHEIQKQWRSRYDALLAQSESLRQGHDRLLADYGILLGQHGTLQQGYDLLLAEHGALLDQHNQLGRDHDRLVAEYNSLVDQYSRLQQDHDRLMAEYNTLLDQHSQLQQDHNRLVAEHKSLVDQHGRLQQDYNRLTAEYSALSDQYSQLQQEYDSLFAEYDTLLSVAITPPYICIYNRNVDIAFYNMDQSVDYWQVPFASLEESIEEGVNNREGILARWFSQVPIEDPDTGKRSYVWDFRVFVDPAPFREVMSELYYRTGGGDAFIREAWNIVTQLTVYSSEMQETPRFPLETFLAGGGDCEDTAILLASMVKAAPVNWKVALVYMDSHNPYVLSDVNHVIVHIDTGDRQYYIETTSDYDMEPFGDYVAGWLFYIN
jgi:cell division protein FtsL